MRIVFLVALTFCALKSFSQNGVLKGKVLSDSNGASISGASIMISQLGKVEFSDQNGDFIFRDIPAGIYEIEFSADGYATKQITDQQIISNEISELVVSLLKNETKLEEVVITRTRAATESVKSLLTLQKNSISVSDGISAETIRRTPDKNTSDVLRRISGASVQDNRFVIVRGLNDRYNAAYLNGSPLPSSEPDRKAFSFDIFPSNMLDNLIITKTATPDMPGEFAGGIIQVNTKSIPDKNFSSLSIGGGYNTVTTGNKQLYYEGGKTDWLGIDDGTRTLPSNFPDYRTFLNLDYLQRAELAKNFRSDWRLKEKNFAPNFSFQYSIGRTFEIGEKTLGLIGAVTYNRSNNFNETVRRNFEEQAVGEPTALYSDYFDENYVEQVLGGALLNASLKFNSNNTISFKNLLSINSDDRVVSRNGIPFEASASTNPLLLSSTVRWFTSNKIFTSQIYGEHFFPKDKIKIGWNTSYSSVQRDIPNLRRNIYTRFRDYIDPENPNELDITPTANIANGNAGPDYGGGLFFSENNERIYSGRFDISQKFSTSETGDQELKFGLSGLYRSKDFYARQLSYNQLGGVGDLVFDQNLLHLPDEEIFNQANMGIIAPGVGGFTLYDGTKYFDAYDANSKLYAAYMMMDNSYKFLHIIYGARVENFNQQLDTQLTETEVLKINETKFDFLPSVNIIIALNKKQNLRFSYSKTVNRPEFRELAPFAFYDFTTQFITSGNPTLSRSLIENTDFRYEFYPGRGQLLSFSLFYKDFKSPIEIKAGVNNKEISYQNAKAAYNYGGEIEFRALLGSVFNQPGSKFLNNLTLFSNLAIIRSEVDVSNIAASTDFEKSRPMQGQSPYVFNGGLLYVDKDYGWSASLNANRVGNRIAIVGNVEAEPTLWEKARTFIDLQLTKSLLKNKVEVRFNGQNLLAQDLIFYHNRNLNQKEVTGVSRSINQFFTGDDQNLNGYDKNADDQIWLTRFGRTFSLAVTYSF